jgi:putative ABC transport system substrate-binding protein
MKRREFIITLLCAQAVSLGARAQQSGKARRVGILMPYSPTDQDIQSRVHAFKEELQKLGWIAGANIAFDERWTTDNMDLVRAAMSNLVELKPEVILATGGRVIPLLMKTTSSIPIVVAGGTSPVERGYVKSLSRPGGNVTGFANSELSIIGKALQTLKEISPNISHAAIIYNPDNPGWVLTEKAFEEAAGSLAIEPTIAAVHVLADIERVIGTVAERPDGGIFFPSDVTTTTYLEQIAAIVARHRLPSIYADHSSVRRGGLVYYGTDRTDIYRHCASYVDRILRGERPGDLPYQQPTKYELVINLKTAKALGLTIPPSLLARADEVIE